MRATKKAVQASVPVLNCTIVEIVALEQQIETLAAEAKAKRAAVKQMMEAMELKRHATPLGHEALVIENEVFTWNVEKLQKFLDDKFGEDDEAFEELCPRKPEGAKLRALYEAYIHNGTYVKEFRACAKVSKARKLEVRAPAQTEVEAKADNVSNIKDAVA